MKTLTLLLAALAVAGILQVPGDQPEAYPGQRDDKEPPKDWLCKRPDVDRLGKAGPDEQAHWCSCERIYDADLQWMHEDKNCSVYCHMDHCSCPVSGLKHMPEDQR